MRLAVMLFIATCLAAPVMAQVDTVFLEELTWTEVRDALEAGKTTIIIPTGGTGPHMVLAKHNYLVKYKAGEVAKRLGNALVAPVMAYVPEGEIDPPTGHMRFPGTITTSATRRFLLPRTANGFSRCRSRPPSARFVRFARAAGAKGIEYAGAG